MQQWDQIYQQLGKEFTSQTDNWQNLIGFFKEQQVKQILDVGCGAGEHVIELSKQGFEVSGFDASTVAIEVAKNSLRQQQVNANITVSSMHQSFPYKSETFDAVICQRTINHGTWEQITFTANEIKRVLKPGGWLFVTVLKIPTNNLQPGVRTINQLSVEVFPNRTYKPLEGKEVGIEHYLFNQDRLKQLFPKMKLEKLWLDQGHQPWEKYYCLLASKAS